MVKSKKIRWEVFAPMMIIIAASIITAAVAPEEFYNVENKIVEFAINTFGWLFDLFGLFLVLMCFYLMVSKYGDIKFGGADAKPEFSNWSWFAITLTSGIAVGILFWGIAEPLYHFCSPPKVLGLEPYTENAAIFALSTATLHWTFTPYAMYTISGLVVCFTHYNMKLPYTQGATLYPIFREKSFGIVGKIIDNLCLFAIIGGVAACLGVGTLQIASGLSILAGIKPEPAVWSIIVIIMTAAYILFSYMGIKKGINWLASQNTKLFLGLMLFLVVFGPTTFIFKLGAQSLGDYLQNFFTKSLWLSPIDQSDWPRWWTIYYWAIWLAYAPTSGMFFARLAYGRTVKEFILVNLVATSLFGLLWFWIFGGSAIYFEMMNKNLWSLVSSGGLEASLFAFLKNIPLSSLLSWIMLVTIGISFTTMADSMTTTIAAMNTTGNTKDDPEPPQYMKILWGVIVGLMALITVTVGTGGKISGIDATKMIATVAGFPILFYCIAQSYSIIKFLMNREKFDIIYYPETAERIEYIEE
ncbi:BCCT family transporter [Thermosediminibacter litoriperuensis]|uniref:Choline/carnitine/betaine transport n=1 Tax=Thermosediminibacter litoriperuensis TaxID=291989 RepID=A0A5S5AL38_9FIRM|nr:BCCT family transporter [Thermosediminibacter litoriperuensis]TYP51595.1 choline/carnitine/betaine transport [Thermosediminibacter litoriperuensis]